MPSATSEESWPDLEEDFDRIKEVAHVLGEISQIELTQKQINAELAFQRRKRKKGFGFDVAATDN